MTPANAVAQAVASLALGRADDARALLEAHLRAQPDDGYARAQLAQTHLALDDPDAASRVVDTLAGDPHFAGTVARFRASIAMARAARQRGTGRGWRKRRDALLQEGVAHAEDAVRVEPSAWQSHARFSLAHTAAAEATDSPHHREMAVRAAREAVRAAGTDDAASASAAAILASAAAHLPLHGGEAIRAAQHAVALDPTNPAYAGVLAAVQHQTRQEARSMASALRALRAAPTDRDIAALARISLYVMLSRMLTLGACAAVIVAIVSLGALSSSLGFPVSVRIGGFSGVVLLSTIVGLTALPFFADAEVRRAVLTFGRKRGSAWLAAGALALALLLYLAALTTGWPFAVAFTGLMLPLARIVHGWLGWRLPG